MKASAGMLETPPFEELAHAADAEAQQHDAVEFIVLASARRIDRR